MPSAFTASVITILPTAARKLRQQEKEEATVTRLKFAACSMLLGALAAASSIANTCTNVQLADRTTQDQLVLHRQPTATESSHSRLTNALTLATKLRSIKRAQDILTD